MKLIAFLLATILITNLGPSCITSSEEFAAEAVIPNYSLQNLNGWKITSVGYTSVAESDSRLIVILSETSLGLSIKIQTPTDIVSSNEPLLKIVSNSAKGTIRSNLGRTVNGWSINCIDQACQVEKNNVLIETNPSGSGLETSVEIKNSLSACNENCRGICISAAQNPVCVDSQTKQDIDVILKYMNISNNFNELLESYRVPSEYLEIKDLSPAFSESINWNEVMQQELTVLKNKGIISLDDKDISDISSLANRGQAGEKYRIVYNAGTWTYYYKIPGATFSNTKDCNAYSIEVQTSPEQPDLNTFYLVPIILVSAAVVLFLVLIIVSRTLLVERNPQKI